MKFLKFIPGFTYRAVNWIARLARFLVIVLVFYAIYKLLLEQLLDGSTLIVPIIALWILSTYAFIPWVHRKLTKYYLPNYFVGRIRSTDGLLSDPINVALFGSASDVHTAMTKAGWTKADDLNIHTLARALYCSIFRKSYNSAPVGTFFLFNRKQDFAYQQEVDGSPNKRHHVRFWKTPKNWCLPGGHNAEWLAAGTYDRKIGFKLSTGRIDHIIHESIDDERDYIIESLQKVKKIKKLEIIKHFTDAYHDRNNGGDRIKTDGSLPFVYLKSS